MQKLFSDVFDFRKIKKMIFQKPSHHITFALPIDLTALLFFPQIKF